MQLLLGNNVKAIRLELPGIYKIAFILDIQ